MDTTTQATALLMVLVSARASDMNRSMPTINATPATGRSGITANVATRATKPLPELELVNPRQRPENDDDEEGARDVEGADQHAERADRLDAVATDGEGHRAECADRCEPHDESERREEHVREAVDAVEHDAP